jgi:hypothetical protein
MCFFDTPSMPKQKEPQTLKRPDSMSEFRRRPNQSSGAMVGGTWLTGVGGVPTAAVNTGSTTLLGG